MTAPEEICQFAVADLSRVKFDPDRLGMVPEIAVGGISFCSPRVSDTGPRDAFDAPKLGIYSPESAERKGGGLCAGCGGGVSRECSGGNAPQKKPRNT